MDNYEIFRDDGKTGHIKIASKERGIIDMKQMKAFENKRADTTKWIEKEGIEL
jgi:hypothetical protein